MNLYFFSCIIEREKNLLMKKTHFTSLKLALWVALLSSFSFLLSGCVTAYAESTAPAPASQPTASGEPVLVKPTLPIEATQGPLPKNFPVNPAPTVTSPVAIVMDPSTREILFQKNIHERRAVASTQKLLTAIVALEQAEGSVASVPVEATKLEPSKLYLRAGVEYEMNYLIKALMVKSANDVAYTIAHGAGGSFEGFMTLMNQKAAALGMKNSHFKNASGLTLEGQYSTAYDIALCAAVAYQHPYIRECVSTEKMTFNHVDGRVKNLVNTNELLKRVPYCNGMKTGTTRASGNCLVSSGELNGRVMIVGVFGAPSKSTLWKESEALLRWSLER